MHAELLEPAVEHDGHERELPFPAPLAGEANPRVPAAAVGRHLPAAAVPGAESHVAIRTARITMLHCFIVSPVQCKRSSIALGVN